MVPIRVEIVDPEGRKAEFSGSHAATSGQLTIPFDFAANDRVGVWEIRATELASGKSVRAYVRLVDRRGEAAAAPAKAKKVTDTLIQILRQVVVGSLAH